MSNNKQSSSVDWLITEIQRRVAIIQSEPQTMARELMINNLAIDLEQAIAMHKEETVDLIVQYEIKHHLIFTEEGILNTVKKAEQYYNETYGGNNEQQ